MQEKKERVALTSIFASGGLTLAKAVVGIMSGSLAILSEAAHSFIDFLATLMTYFAVRLSGRPADDEHHYGHGKIESLAALAETLLLFLLSGVVIWEAVRRLLGEGHGIVEVGFWAFAVIIVSVVVDFFRARLLYRVASETRSEALEADALHFSSDMWSSLAVLVGLAGVWFGYPWADSAAALLVAALVCVAGWRLASHTISSLVDRAPAGVADDVRRIIEGVPGVIAIESLRVRRSGAVLFADVSVEISRLLPLERAAEIKSAVSGAVVAAMPEAEVSVVTTPRALDDESVVERVLVIARNRGLAVHHVTVHAFGDTQAVALDLEVDGKLPLSAAHAIADGLERAIENELGAGVEVETHIEPLQIEDRAGTVAPETRLAAVAGALSEIAAADGPLHDVHSVRVRDTDEGEIVNFHCRVSPDLTVEAVHEHVDDLERRLRERWPAIRRVIGHAEPQPRS
ncbi:MAG: cation diffusion facilitator family transporter [Rhizobiales bacterium]|nr:cation diffusion facilitator family transporter [Hyphomicrobiales bacterium]